MQLRAGDTRSCGCLRSELISARAGTHRRSGSTAYRVWLGMLDRTTRKGRRDFKHYGGRGIRVCERWMAFKNFLADMGDPPPGMTIERIDNNRGYEPGNCRWASHLEQVNNRRNNVMVSLNGQAMTLSQAARATGTNYHAMYDEVVRRGGSMHGVAAVRKGSNGIGQ